MIRHLVGCLITLEYVGEQSHNPVDWHAIWQFVSLDSLGTSNIKDLCGQFGLEMVL